AVAPDQPDAIALVNSERRGVEYHAVTVAHGDFSGGEDGGHVFNHEYTRIDTNGNRLIRVYWCSFVVLFLCCLYRQRGQRYALVGFGEIFGRPVVGKKH